MIPLMPLRGIACSDNSYCGAALYIYLDSFLGEKAKIGALSSAGNVVI